MNKLLNLIIIIGSLAIVLILAFVGYSALTADSQPDNLALYDPPAETSGASVSGTAAGDAADSDPNASSTAAPDFTVYDADGNAYKLSDFRGKPVVLNFWASWCGPCKNEMPDFDAAYAQYGDQIHFLMVNLTDGSSETVQSASSFIAGAGYSFPVYFDTDMDAAAVYGISSIPVTYFIDANGYLVAQGRGSLSADNLQKGIDMLLP